MKRINILFFIFLFIVCGLNVEGEVPKKISVNIKKSFDFGTLIDHDITVTQNTEIKASIRFSQRRKKEGAEEIANSFLSYNYAPLKDTGFLTIDEQRFYIGKIMRAIHEKFGNDLKIESLMSSRYLGVKETEKRAIQAFKDFGDWKKYLKDKTIYTQHEIYDIIQHRLREKKVFSDIIDLFHELGYSIDFSGFEKLFILNAGECPFYSELETLGIKKEDKFPYPGMVYFSVKRITE